MSAKEIGYFDVLTSIINKKTIPDEAIKKHFVGFPAIKWLSGNPMACYTSNQINSVRGNKYIPKEAEYNYLKNSIKLHKNIKIPFDRIDKEYNTLYKVLQSHFNVGPTTLNEYLKILKNEDILDILEKRSLPGVQTKDTNILELRNALNKKRKDIIKGKVF